MWVVLVIYIHCIVTEAFLNLTEVFLTLTEVFLTLTDVFLTLTEGFTCFLFSCKANARIKLAKTVHGPHSTTLVVFVLFGCYLCCSMYCLCVNVYCHWVTTQLQLISISMRTELAFAAELGRFNYLNFGSEILHTHIHRTARRVIFIKVIE